MEPSFNRDGVTIYTGDCREVLRGLESGSAQCCVTSPPYWGLRDYGTDSQLGLESTPDEYVQTMVEVFREVRRVLRDDGTLWLNLGDSYNAGREGGHAGGANGASKPENAPGRSGVNAPGLKPKDLVGIPWRVAFALQADGWWLRQDIIWHKPNPMPESVTDRCTKAHEYIFLLAKSARYHYDADAIREPGVDPERERSDRIGGAHGHSVRHSVGGYMLGTSETKNKRSVWTVTTKPYKDAHFATFPPDLIEPCIKAGCPEGGTVLDPFLGSGTTAAVAQDFGRKCLGIELAQEYVELAKKRFEQRKLFGIEPG